MIDTLPVPVPTTDIEKARRATAEFITASKAKATRSAYASDWRDFEAWCAPLGLASLPANPETVATYLSALATAGRKFSTIGRRCAAIAFFHRSAGADNPTSHLGVRAVLSGIARTIGAAPTKKAALTVGILEKVLRRIPDDLAGLRDRAILLIGFAGALRRSELVALNLEDVARHPKGIVLTLRRSKTDQAGAGKTKAIPHGRKLHPVGAFDAWTAAAGITSGPIFRGVRGSRVLADRLHPKQVARIVKMRARAAALDPALFAGHSLRSGFITSAADSGSSLQSIASHAGHEKLETTLGYVQVADAFRDHSGKRFL